LRKTIDDPDVQIELLQEPESTAASPTNTALFRAMVKPRGRLPGRRRHRVDHARRHRFALLPPPRLPATASSGPGLEAVHGRRARRRRRLPVAALGDAVRVIYDALRML
jgi:hypothetical protein